MPTLLLASMLALQVPPQPPADFSGRWQLVSPVASPTVPAELLFDGPSATQTILIERHFTDGVRQEPYSTDPTHVGMLLDAKWVGATLVFPLRGNGGRGAAPPTPDREEVWSLDAGGLLHIDVTERLPRAQATTTSLVYRRLPAQARRSDENLLQNPGGDLALTHWLPIGDAKIEPCGSDPCLVVRNKGSFRQTVLLPDDAAGRFLVIIGAGSSERINPDGVITGLPSLYGTFSPAGGGRILGYLQDVGTLGRPESPDRWVTLSGVFPVPAGATRVNFQLNQAEARGTPQNGSAARFDDLGVYLFATQAEARVFAATRSDSRRSTTTLARATAPQVLPGTATPRPAPPTPPADPNVARDVHLRLSIRDGKTTFRSGEAIRLVMSFTADQPGYSVNRLVERGYVLPDEIVITPAAGVNRWFERYGGHSPDFSISENLTTQPFDLTLPLNYHVRFDEPGEYTVRIRTRRVAVSGVGRASDQAWLETGPVTFRIVPMTSEEEPAEVRRLSALIDTSQRCDTPVDAEHCDDLAFLAGDGATREKVRRILSPPPRNLAGWSAFALGLYISRNTSLAISLLEADLRDLNRPADGIAALARLRLWAEGATFAPTGFGTRPAITPETTRLAEVQREYMDEVLASLPRRIGTARRDAALNVLPLYARSPVSRPVGDPSPVPLEIRRVIVEQFTSLDPMNQSALLQTRWPDIRDPALRPAIGTLSESRDPWIRAQALGPLLELAPEKARPIFIAEMLDVRSMAGDVLLKLPDATLPEIERPLLAQIAQMPLPRDASRFRLLAKLLARYGTSSIAAEMDRLYADWQRNPTDRELGEVLKAYSDRVHRGGDGIVRQRPQ